MKRKLRIGALAAALVLAAALWGAAALGAHAAASVRAQAAESVRAAVLDAAVQCYVLEGAYPRSLAYLEENYGVQINRDRFIVSYEAFASNLLPDVLVLERAGA